MLARWFLDGSSHATCFEIAVISDKSVDIFGAQNYDSAGLAPPFWQPGVSLQFEGTLGGHGSSIKVLEVWSRIFH